ncbi:hypothetical protein LTR08_003736 [Meristemomyces frigidus]|nr:hypothetical protein LTR08_003736 [Meristemomyces frigidus]
MSHNADRDRDHLPDLSDEDVALLHQITTRARASPKPPFKALFAAYTAVFAEQGIEEEHDGVVFRLLLRVGEATGKSGRSGGVVDLVGCLRELLAAQGITIVDNDEDGEGDQEDVGEETRSVVVASAGPVNGAARPAGGGKKDPERRRVSFNDARLDETWLSEHSRPLLASPPRQQGLLSQPARRGRFPDAPNGRRARSTSSQRTRVRHPTPAHSHQAPTSAAYTSEHLHEASPSSVYTSDHNINPTLLFQPSQTQLEQNAEAFASTSTIRSGRQCLHIWHDRALILRQTRQQAYAIAAAHDGHTLLKQAFDQWRTNLVFRQDTRREEEYWDGKSKEAGLVSDEHSVRKAFSHWMWSTRGQREAIRHAKGMLLATRCFLHWRSVTLANMVKVRKILTTKHWVKWRRRIDEEKWKDEQAVVRYEETTRKACLRSLFRQHCSAKAERWGAVRVKMQAFKIWVERVQDRRQLEVQAVVHHRAYAAQRTITCLRQRLTECQAHNQHANAHHDRHLTATCLHSISIEAKLGPLAHTLALKIRLDIQRKAFATWHRHFQLSRQAADVNRRRILQSAWTDWNDQLRCRALGQRIDERVLVEALYKWVLTERMRLFRRNSDARLLSNALNTWRRKVAELRAKTAEAEAAFAEAQERRWLAYGMLKLHTAMRQREDAERAAVEFANARALPNVLQVLAAKTRHVLELKKWAGDARFYTLCTRSLAVWRERTTQHVHNRRRDAYARVRARAKTRLVGGCLAIWHAKTAAVGALHEEAERRAQVRTFHVGTDAFDRWRDRTAQLQHMSEQATAVGRQRLLGSALSALASYSAQFRAMDDQALAFGHETDLAALAAALKKIQWATFTACRRSESAGALWARNRDQHVRAMLRHWFSQAASRREVKNRAEEEPDSPSLRPASRAASRSAQRPPPTSPPGATTPAYMRTPSRSRRAGRFRGLPTPAPMTPFGFDPAYLATTPAPLSFTAPHAAFAAEDARDVGLDEILTPQVTPFARKLRAGGFAGVTPAPVLRRSAFGRSGLGTGLGSGIGAVGGTAKSVRFAAAGGRFGGGGSS